MVSNNKPKEFERDAYLNNTSYVVTVPAELIKLGLIDPSKPIICTFTQSDNDQEATEARDAAKDSSVLHPQPVEADSKSTLTPTYPPGLSPTQEQKDKEVFFIH